jgi:hypothetical protein
MIRRKKLGETHSEGGGVERTTARQDKHTDQNRGFATAGKYTATEACGTSHRRDMPGGQEARDREKLQGLPRETEPGNEGAGARMNTYTTLECLQRMTHAEPAGPLASLAEKMRGTLLRKRKQRQFWGTTQGHQRPLCLAKPSRLAQRHITQIPCATAERAKQQG